uniref:THAP-type domain-containing protein n=1 Tax=Daphnia galeata TaxID=27404 RepID=A0A8J2RVF2_9CRUS|nr:unnamed protein product [Daphnia galeata]
MPKCTCCVRFCNSSNLVEKNSKLHFFSWPKDENVVETWLKAFSDNSFVTGFSKYFKVTKNLRICSLHFEAKFVNEKTKNLLQMLFLPFFNYQHITPRRQACTTATNVDRTPLSNLNGRLKCVPSIKVTSSDKTGSSFFARDLHQHSTSTHSNTISGDVGYNFSLPSANTNDTTVDYNKDHEIDQNYKSTSHSNALSGDVELSLLSATTSDSTMDYLFDHDLDRNGTSTSHSNAYRCDSELSLLSATTRDIAVDHDFYHSFNENGRSTSNSNEFNGDVEFDLSILTEATSDTTLDSFGHDLDENGRSTSHSNVVQGHLELSLLSGTTSDITLDSFGHDLDPNGRSTSYSNNLGGDLQLSLLNATTGDTTVNSFGHDFDQNGRSTSHSNALTGDLDMSLLSATTSDKTLNSFGHELQPNDRSTSHYNDLGGDLELSYLSVTQKDTTADSFSNEIGIDSSVVHLLDSSILDLDNSSTVLKEDSLLHPNCNSISQPPKTDDCRFPKFSSNIIPDPVTSFNREIFLILQNYKKTGDCNAANSHLHELQVESFHNELVYTIVMEAVDSELEVDETRWLKLLTSFMLAKIIPNDQLKKAMLKIFDKLEWIHRNIPNGIRKLVRFCNKCQTAGIMEAEMISILNYNCLKTAVKEVVSSNNTNEVTKEPKEYKEKTKKKILSKDPLTNNRMLVRKLRHQVENLENQIKQLENLVGLQTIKLCKLDKRMTAAIKSLVNVFEEECDKQSEQNAKASFLLCQVIDFFSVEFQISIKLIFVFVSS